MNVLDLLFCLELSQQPEIFHKVIKSASELLRTANVRCTALAHAFITVTDCDISDAVSFS